MCVCVCACEWIWGGKQSSGGAVRCLPSTHQKTLQDAERGNTGVVSNGGDGSFKDQDFKNGWGAKGLKQ